MALSLRSGIAPDVWLRQPAGYIETAIMLYEIEDKENER